MADQEQLDIAKDLLKATQQIEQATKRVSRVYGEQADMMEKLRDTLEEISESDALDNTGTMAENIREIGENVRRMSDESTIAFDQFADDVEGSASTAETLTNRIRDASDSMTEMTQHTFDRPRRGLLGLVSSGGLTQDIFGKVRKFMTGPLFIAMGGLMGFVTGLAQSFTNLFALGKAAGSFFTKIIAWAFELGAAIIAIPIKIITGLIDLAAKANLGTAELLRQMEEVRKEFGRFSGPTSKAVMSTFRTMENFNQTGLSLYRVFGLFHERLQRVREVAVAMGATFNELRREFEQNGGALLAFQKGLGISDEQMKVFGRRSKTFGRSMASEFTEITQITEDLGAAFEVDAKILSKDVVKALADVAHFGGATVKQITEASVYARKLGLELDNIVGLLDQFDTFDAAAENASKLAQSFGVNVNAFELMAAQDPASQLDMLRKAFSRAGVDSQHFNRAQLKLLKNTTGLDEEVARLAFSMNNQGMSMDAIRKKADESKKKTLTQAEALDKLASSIERMVKEMQQMEGSFVKMFFKGFLTGIQRSQKFRGLIWDIKKALMLTWREGFKLGRVFIGMWPGLDKVFTGLREFFRPQTFKKFVHGITDEIKWFFKEISAGRYSFGELMKRLQKRFFDFFNSKMPAGKQMLDGFKKIMKDISGVVASAVKWIGEKLVDGIKFITDVISGKVSLVGVAAVGEGALGFLTDLIMPILENLKKLGPPLWEALKELGLVAWEKAVKLWETKIYPVIEPHLTKIMIGLAAIMFGPAIGRAFLGAGGNFFAQMFYRSITRRDTQSAVKKAMEELSEKAKPMAGAAGGAGAKAGAVAAETTTSFKVASKQAAAMALGQVAKLFLILVAIGAGLAVGGVIFAKGLKKMAAELKGTSTKDLIKAGAAVAEMTLVAAGIALAARVVAKVGRSALQDIAIGAGIITVLMTLVGAVTALVAWIFSKVGSPAELNAAGKIMLSMSLVFLAMVPLLIAAAAIGAVVSTGYGAAILAVAAVGFGVITAAVTAIAGTAAEIVQTVKKLGIGPELVPAIDAFLGIIKAINALITTLVKVLDVMMPSFTDFLTMGFNANKKMNKAVEMIETMIGDEKGGGISGLMTLVQQIVKKFSRGGDKMMKAAEFFGNVLGALGPLMTAMNPPESFYQAGKKLGISPITGVSFEKQSNDVIQYMDVIEKHTSKLMTQSQGIIKELSRLQLDENQIKSMPAIAKILSAVTNVVQALTPDAETIKQFRQTEKAEVSSGVVGIYASATKQVETLNAPALSKFIDAIKGSMKGVLAQMFGSGGALDQAVKLAGNIDPKKAKTFTVIADLIGAIAAVVAAIGEAGKAAINVGGVKAEAGEDANIKQIINVTNQVPNVAQVLNKLGQAGGPISNMFGTIIGLVRQTKDSMTPELLKHLDTTSKIIEMMVNVSKAVNHFSSLAKDVDVTDVGPQLRMMDGALGAITIARAWLRMLYSGKFASNLSKYWDDASTSPVEALGKAATKFASTVAVTGLGDAMFEYMNKMLMGMTKFMEVVFGFGNDVTSLTIPDSMMVDEALKNLSDVVNVLEASSKANLSTKFATNMAKYVQGFKDVDASIRTSGLQPAVLAVADMVNTVNEMNSLLSDNEIMNVNVTAGMKSIADSLGIGGRAEFAIHNKPINITVNFKVEMSVDEVEKVMVFRKKSVVRDQLRAAAEEPKKFSEAKKLVKTINGPASTYDHFYNN